LTILAIAIAVMILGTGVVTAQAPEAKIISVTYPLSPVRPGESFNVGVTISYSFSVTSRTNVTIQDVATGYGLGSKDEYLDRSGQKSYYFPLTAPGVAKEWRLRALVEYTAMGIWTHDKEDWYKEFTITVRGDFSLVIQGVVDSWVFVDSMNSTVGSSGVFSTTLAVGMHSIEVPKIIYVSSGTRRVFKEWKDGHASNSRTILLSVDTTLYVLYETQHFLFVGSDVSVTLGGQGWYKEGDSATIFLDPTEVPVEGMSGLLGVRRTFAYWTEDHLPIGGISRTSVTVERPKMIWARWRTSYDRSYVNLGIVTTVVVAILAVFVVRSRRRPPPPRPIITGTTYGVPLRAPTAPPLPLLRVQPVREKKFCTQCGAEMDVSAVRCPACGRQQ